jgi:demethoxyubiquinone hydroxylase (CLK1/Coq7/Cat5 family)
MCTRFLYLYARNLTLRESNQLKDFESLPSSHPSIPLLREVIRELRDDELDHLDIAVERHAQRAPAHALLSTAVGGGCKIAIKLCKRFRTTRWIENRNSA